MAITVKKSKTGLKPSGGEAQAAEGATAETAAPETGGGAGGGIPPGLLPQAEPTSYTGSVIVAVIAIVCVALLLVLQAKENADYRSAFPIVNPSAGSMP